MIPHIERPLRPVNGLGSTSGLNTSDTRDFARGLWFFVKKGLISEGCCLTLLKFKVGVPGREGFSEFKSFFRHLFHIRHFRQYIFYHYLMGFQTLHPTIPPLRTFRHIILIVLRFLKGKCYVLHKFVHISDFQS